MAMRELLIVGLVFNGYWLLAVIGQGHYIWLLFIVLIASWWFYKGSWRFGLLLGTAGIVMDFLLSLLGLYQFQGPVFPAWLVLLWLGFGSFVWIIRRAIVAYSPLVVIAIGGLGGMMSYLAGFRLGAVHWPLGFEMTALSVLVCWLCFSALALKLLGRYGRPDSEDA